MGVCCMGVELVRKHRQSASAEEPTQWRSGRLLRTSNHSRSQRQPSGSSLLWLSFPSVTCCGAESASAPPADFLLPLLSSQLHASRSLSASAPWCLLIGIARGFLGSLKAWFFQLFSFYVAQIQTFLEGEPAYKTDSFGSGTKPYSIICSQGGCVLVSKTWWFI